MNCMKIALVYFSRTGNAKIIAELLKDKLVKNNAECDVIEVIPEKKRGFFRSIFAGLKQKPLPIKNGSIDLSEYKNIIAGAPIWAGRPSPYIKSFFIKAMNTKGKKVYCFYTCGGSSDQQQKALETYKENLKALGMKVSKHHLGLKMDKKHNIKEGEDQIGKFIDKVR